MPGMRAVSDQRLKKPMSGRNGGMKRARNKRKKLRITVKIRPFEQEAPPYLDSVIWDWLATTLCGAAHS